MMLSVKLYLVSCSNLLLISYFTVGHHMTEHSTFCFIIKLYTFIIILNYIQLGRLCDRMPITDTSAEVADNHETKVQVKIKR